MLIKKRCTLSGMGRFNFSLVLVSFRSINSIDSMTKETTVKYLIFDTDMGCDDAWALQMVLKAEKHFKNVKVLAITAVNGNTTVKNVVKNTYRILDGLDRTDVRFFFVLNVTQFQMGKSNILRS